MVAGALDDEAASDNANASTRCCVRSTGYSILQRRTCGWPLLGLADSDARPDVHWSPAEASAVVAWHREAAAFETGKRQLMIPMGEATPKVKGEHLSDNDDSLKKRAEALQVKQHGQEQGGKGAKAKDAGTK